MPSNLATLPALATTDVPYLLERARHRLGWSQWRAAAELRIDPRTWQRWEAGDCRAPVDALRRSPALWRAFLIESGDLPEQEAA